MKGIFEPRYQRIDFPPQPGTQATENADHRDKFLSNNNQHWKLAQPRMRSGSVRAKRKGKRALPIYFLFRLNATLELVILPERTAEWAMSFVDRDEISLEALHNALDCSSSLRLCAKSFAVDGDICRPPPVGVRASSPAALADKLKRLMVGSA